MRNISPVYICVYGDDKLIRFHLQQLATDECPLRRCSVRSRDYHKSITSKHHKVTVIEFFQEQLCLHRYAQPLQSAFWRLTPARNKPYNKP